MKTSLECIPCFLRQSLEASRMITDDENVHEQVLKTLLKHLQTVSFNYCPPRISRDVHDIIRSITKSSDPYREIKDQSNKMAKKRYPYLKQILANSDDPLLAAIKIAIVGNVIDFGTMNRFKVDDMIDIIIEKDIDSQSYSQFKQALKNTNNILYLADNAGEIYFDKILIEKLVEQNKHVTYVVKANPIINDATIEDAQTAGINQLATVMEGDKGQDVSAPGILLYYASDEFLDHFNTAEMVIAKGQGNYESLSDSSRKIFFLLMVKCPLVAHHLGVEMAKPVFKVI